MNYMREYTEDSYAIKPLQDKILEIAIYVDRFCEKFDIDYCLMGGSALGAKRHGGFIPWDDDLDIFMTPDNYEKFRKYFNLYGDKEKFYLQECGKRKNGMVTVPKLRMNGTMYTEELTKDWDIHHGIFIDIFILHNCPNNIILQLWQCLWAKCSIIKKLSMRAHKEKTGLIKFLLDISKFIPERLMLDFALKQVYKFRDKKTEYCCHFLGKAVFKKGIYKKEWFEDTEYLPFETVELKVPIGLHKYLSERFGDYMIMPDEQSIKRAQHAVEWCADLRTEDSVKEKYNDEYKLL